MEKVVQTLYNAKPHAVPNHITVFGTNGLEDDLTPFVVVLNTLAASHEQQAQGFGVLLKKWGMRAEKVVLVVHGTMPNLRLRPVSIVLGMTRGGDYEQVVVDYQAQQSLPSENISEEDKAICSAIFFGQASYKPELSNSVWN